STLWYTMDTKFSKFSILLLQISKFIVIFVLATTILVYFAHLQYIIEWQEGGLPFFLFFISSEIFGFCQLLFYTKFLGESAAMGYVG
ncbi:MAG: hypothetical protein IKM59_07120, partial [Oscillospiraceae bacterium]|nr:hypothetical protein [Oscillospiraceae bacterium]